MIISAKKANSEFLSAIKTLDKTGKVPVIQNENGKKYVVMREEDYRGWLETAYLLSTTANAKALQDGMNEPLENCIPLSEVRKKYSF